MAPTRSRIMAHDELEECNTGMYVVCRYVILIRAYILILCHICL